MAGRFGAERVAGKAERREAVGQIVERQAGVDEGGESHIAADAGGHIEIGDPRHAASVVFVVAVTSARN